MRALSVLGSSSNSGKSWVTTALCRLLCRNGIRVVPFKAQNMSNNSFVTMDGKEIGRAQAVQAEACRMIPSALINPILLKPTGKSGSQLIVDGIAQGHFTAREFYARTEELWPAVVGALEQLRAQYDVIILEGAGSPVELNLLRGDLANLRPIRYLDAKWVLVADIERGGVFAHLVGTWQLLTREDQQRGLGMIVNKFRGDLSLFAGARQCLAERVDTPYLGVLPFREDLQPESEDSLCREAEEGGSGGKLAWIRFPHLSNSQDCQPWRMDQGVQIAWIQKTEELDEVRAVVLPGSKNTISDLEWLHESGLASRLKQLASLGVPIMGICGGYQMLGEVVADPDGCAGDAGQVPGLGLLPIKTFFAKTKTVAQVQAGYGNERWDAYEIHMGESLPVSPCASFLSVSDRAGTRNEGSYREKVWGTYVHGVFESSEVRSTFISAGYFDGYRASRSSWRKRMDQVYESMADLLEQHLELEEVWRYVAG